MVEMLVHFLELNNLNLCHFRWPILILDFEFIVKKLVNEFIQHSLGSGNHQWHGCQRVWQRSQWRLSHPKRYLIQYYSWPWRDFRRQFWALRTGLEPFVNKLKFSCSTLVRLTLMPCWFQALQNRSRLPFVLGKIKKIKIKKNKFYLVCRGLIIWLDGRHLSFIMFHDSADDAVLYSEFSYVSTCCLTRR